MPPERRAAGASSDLPVGRTRTGAARGALQPLSPAAEGGSGRRQKGLHAAHVARAPGRGPGAVACQPLSQATWRSVTLLLPVSWNTAASTLMLPPPDVASTRARWSH